MENFSPEAWALIEKISAQEKPFTHETLTEFISEPGADEVLVKKSPYLQLRKGVMAAILGLITRNKKPSPAYLKLVPSPDHNQAD